MITKLWAKSRPYKSLIVHMKEAGKCGQRLLAVSTLQPICKKFARCFSMSETEIQSFVGYWISLHDIGKCHPLFQGKDMSLPATEDLIAKKMLYKGLPLDSKNKFRHERYTYSVCERLFSDWARKNEDLWVALFRTLEMHHQGKEGDPSTTLRKDCNEAAWEDLQNQLNECMIAEFQPVFPEHYINEEIDSVIYLLMGLVILSDWIVSDEQFLSESDTIDNEIKKRGLIPEKQIVSNDNFCSVFRNFQREFLRGVQSKAEEAGHIPAGLYLLEAPMGEGKTEAALYLATRQMEMFHKNGLYMALPTSATGNQMFKRVKEWFCSHDMNNVRLLHSTAWMIDESTPEQQPIIDREKSGDEEQAQQWLAPLRRGLLSQYAVGTIDQAMLSVMNVKYGILRLLGLSGKVLIIDEIHAYSVYMDTIIGSLLAWCRAIEIPVVMMSATLPRIKKESLLKAYGGQIQNEFSKDYPLITSVSTEGKVSETVVDKVHMHRNFKTRLRPYLDKPKETAELAAELAQSGGCICVLVNTVRKAQEVYRQLCEMKLTCTVTLFHARFTAEDRQLIEEESVRLYGKNFEDRPSSGILVATQVMEQSMDVDFDVMITDMAPIDLLLQRMGRVHRFDQTVRPNDKREPLIYVLTSDDDYEKQYVYAPLLMKRTHRLLQEQSEIKTPEQIRECVELVYTEGVREKDEFEEWAKEKFQNQFDAAKAEGGVMPKPQKEGALFSETTIKLVKDDDATSNMSAKTRLGEEGRRLVLLPREEVIRLPEQVSREKAKELLKKSVASRTELFGAVPEGFKEGKGLLRGVLFVPTTEDEARWGSYILSYDKEVGLCYRKG